MIKQIHISILIVSILAYSVRAALSYLYTGQAVFAPIKSTGKDTPDKFEDSCVAASPKSLYRLADKVAISLSRNR